MSSALRTGVLAGAVALLLVALASAVQAQRLALPAGILAGIGVLAASGVAFFLHSRNRRRLADARVEAAQTLAALGEPVPADPVDAMVRSLDVLAGRVRDAEGELSRQRAEREAAEAALRESEERYALAVRGADDGMWEWSLKDGRMHFSARWKAMLGYAEDEIADSLDEWFGRVHPDDRERVESELRAHAGGATPRFENEHRLRHRDGGWRWILARGAAVHNAAGRAYRVVGLHTDITSRKQIQEALIEVADGLATLAGEACLQELSRKFAEVLGVREVFVCECCDYPTTRVRMLARWNRGHFDDCVEFDLAGTTCEDVIESGNTVHVPERLGDRWPLERQFERESYLGLPCHDTRGRVIGHIACADGGPMRHELPHLAILKIFAIRAALELERRLLERESHGSEGRVLHAREESLRVL